MQGPDRKYKRSDIAWKPDYTLLAVGNEDGLVMLLEKHLCLLDFFFFPSLHTSSPVFSVEIHCCCDIDKVVPVPN
jgi:hypothetical protein